MSYRYEDERAALFTDEGQRLFLKVRDRARALMDASGAATVGRMIDVDTPGDTFLMLVCVDRLVELGEIRRVSADSAAQFHVYVPTVRR